MFRCEKLVGIGSADSIRRGLIYRLKKHFIRDYLTSRRGYTFVVAAMLHPKKVKQKVIKNHSPRVVFY